MSATLPKRTTREVEIVALTVTDYESPEEDACEIIMSAKTASDVVSSSLALLAVLEDSEILDRIKSASVKSAVATRMREFQQHLDTSGITKKLKALGQRREKHEDENHDE